MNTIIIIMIIIFFILNSNTVSNKIINTNSNISNNKVSNITNTINKNNVEFRGLAPIMIKEPYHEIGGSKIFKNIRLDNTNLKNNVVKFNKYESYRIKPYVIK